MLGKSVQQKSFLKQLLWLPLSAGFIVLGAGTPIPMWLFLSAMVVALFVSLNQSENQIRDNPKD